jgi:TonB-dependent receptor
MKRIHLLASTVFSVAALGATCPTGASAQTIPASPAASSQAQTPPSEIVVVTGVRLQNQRAIGIKRATLGVIDTLTADEVGNLPDFNVGDAVRRLPGVNVFYYQGEPRHVSLRGLNADYNSTTVDGFHMASPDPDGRRIFVEVLPSSLAARIDVVKSARADIEGHAIGGTIDFISRSAKDLKGDHFQVSAKGGSFLQKSGFGGTTPTLALEATAGTTFGANDEFGVLVSGSLWQRELFVPQLESGGQAYFFNANGTRTTTPYGGNALRVPQERRWYIYDNDRERSGLNGKFDWRPNQTTYAAINAYSYKHSEASDRYEDTAQVNATSLIANQTEATGTLSGVLRIVQLGQLQFDRSVSGVNLVTQFEPVAQFEVDAKLGWSGAKSTNPQRWDEFRQNNQAYNFDIAGVIHRFTAVNPTQALDASRYPLLNHRDEFQNVNEDVYDSQLDGSWNFSGEGFGYKFGARLQRTDRTVGFERTLFTGTQYNLTNVLDVSSGFVPFGSTGTDFLVVNKSLANTVFGQFGAAMTAARDVTASNNGDYGVKENITATYAMGRFARGPLIASAGLRSEKTEVEGQGLRLVAGVWQTVTTSTSRDDLLPSAAISYAVTDNVRLTASYAKALGRGRYSDLAPRGEVLNETGATPTLSRANPQLKPRIADNYDLAFDWFLDRGLGIVSLALFRKDVTNEIFTFGALETLPLNGVDRQVLVTQARNSPNNVTIDGIEFSFVKELTFLPAPFDGLGISGNYTTLNTDFPITLADQTITQSPGLREQAKDITNLTFFYKHAGLEARLAYNRTGLQWESRFSNFTSQAEFYRNRYQQPYETFDMQVRYELANRITLQLEGQNLLNARKQDNIGRQQEIPQALIGLAPAVYFGIGYRW